MSITLRRRDLASAQRECAGRGGRGHGGMGRRASGRRVEWESCAAPFKQKLSALCSLSTERSGSSPTHVTLSTHPAQPWMGWVRIQAVTSDPIKCGKRPRVRQTKSKKEACRRLSSASSVWEAGGWAGLGCPLPHSSFCASVCVCVRALARPHSHTRGPTRPWTPLARIAAALRAWAAHPNTPYPTRAAGGGHTAFAFLSAHDLQRVNHGALLLCAADCGSAAIAR